MKASNSYDPAGVANVHVLLLRAEQLILRARATASKVLGAKLPPLPQMSTAHLKLCLAVFIVPTPIAPDSVADRLRCPGSVPGYTGSFAEFYMLRNVATA